jgi:hypothetical protein
LCTAQNLFKLALFEARQRGSAPAGVFVVYLDQARNEELLLFVGFGLPVIRFAECHHEAHITGPLLVVLGDRRPREGLNPR